MHRPYDDSALRGAENFCGCCSANFAHVTLAIDGNADELGLLTDDELRDARDALETCRVHECDGHGRERSARRLLDALLDERESDAEQTGPDCPRCNGGNCNDCLGLASPSGGY